MYGVQCTLHVTRLQLINENIIELTDPAIKASSNKNAMQEFWILLICISSEPFYVRGSKTSWRNGWFPGKAITMLNMSEMWKVSVPLENRKNECVQCNNR